MSTNDASEPGDASPTMSLLGVACGVAALGIAGAAMSPWAWPSWPAASLGLLAMGLARRPGPAAWRALGAFLGLIAFVASTAHIALLYSAGRLLG